MSFTSPAPRVSYSSLNLPGSILEPPLSEAEKVELVDGCLHSIFPLPPLDVPKEGDWAEGEAGPREVPAQSLAGGIWQAGRELSVPPDPHPPLWCPFRPLCPLPQGPSPLCSPTAERLKGSACPLQPLWSATLAALKDLLKSLLHRHMTPHGLQTMFEVEDPRGGNLSYGEGLQPAGTASACSVRSTWAPGSSPRRSTSGSEPWK